MPAKGKTKLSKAHKAGILALVPVAGTQAEAAKIAGVSEAVVSRAAKDAETVRMASEQMPAIADQIEQIVNVALQSILPSAANATLRDSLSICQLVDKMLLLRGQATSITQQLQNLSPEQRKEALQNLLEKARVA